jgi:hypothetical protein
MKIFKLKFLMMLTLTFCLGVIVVPSVAGEACVVPDNGTGTITLPPMGCEYTSPDDVFMIINGLPPDTTIEMEGILMDFICCGSSCSNCSLALSGSECEMAGGSLGGHGHCFDATLDLTVTGTGDLEGFHRHLAVPVFCEVHTAPRTPGDPVQDFNSVLFRLQGELFGDPDFCEFRITGGTDFGLPSPGHTTLTELPSGDFAVDSFFDITYQIEFEGCPGSPLDGYAGTTTETIRMETGFAECAAKEDGTGCKDVNCPVQGNECLPVCVNFYPGSGYTAVIDCDCRDINECHLDLGSGLNCVLEDNGTGTVTLPPIGCEYTSPNDVFMIINGLPPDTTIEMEDIWMDFICCGSSCTNCSLALSGSECEMAGGTLGGDGHCFESTLDLTVTGTGELEGFSRHLSVPVSAEVHTGPRTPGDPVQEFNSVVYRFYGELFGDPDFCEFRITAGTDYGLPSPGEMTLTELPSGDFAVDSFFDITYQIEFEGCPGSPLDGYAGTTTATIRMKTGGYDTPPSCSGDCEGCEFCYETMTVNQDGTIDICCNCVPDADLNRDGIVNFKDIAIIANQWLTTR